MRSEVTLFTKVRVEDTDANRLNFALLGQKTVLTSQKGLEIMGRQPLKAIRYPCSLWVKSGHPIKIGPSDYFPLTVFQIAPVISPIDDRR
jgi:hypothetical protein